MANKQFERVLNCIPSRLREKDWRLENALEAGLLAPDPVPASKDLREAWWKIGNQEETGSCVGWASADSVIRWHMVKAGWIDKKDILSPRFIWMAAKEFDEFDLYPTTFIEIAGTSLKAALDISRKYGTVKESILPFRPPKLYPGKPQTFYAIAARLKIASYINMGTQMKDWKAWLAGKGPILTRLDVDETWYKATENGGKMEKYKPQTAQGGHAIALVGYTPKHFIVRNSWGAKWGDRGFGYASYAYAQAAFTEAYGVSL